MGIFLDPIVSVQQTQAKESGMMMKLFAKKVKEEDYLLNEIKKTKLALEAAYLNFEYVVDPDLIDSYIYEVNAVQKRYKFLLKQAKLQDEKNYVI